MDGLVRSSSSVRAVRLLGWLGFLLLSVRSGVFGRRISHVSAPVTLRLFGEARRTANAVLSDCFRLFQAVSASRKEKVSHPDIQDDPLRTAKDRFPPPSRSSVKKLTGFDSPGLALPSGSFLVAFCSTPALTDFEPRISDFVLRGRPVHVRSRFFAKIHAFAPWGEPKQAPSYFLIPNSYLL